MTSQPEFSLSLCSVKKVSNHEKFDMLFLDNYFISLSENELNSKIRH